MPTLLLMRHAKSDWSNAHCDDHDRPLNARGKRDAPRMGRWLKEQGLVPSRIVSSSARRARKTADRVIEGLQAAVPVEIVEELYHATVETWLGVLARLDSSDGCVLCVGHNPGLEGLVEHLAGRHERMPTAAIAKFRLESADWNALSGSQPPVTLEVVWRPKEMTADEME